MPFRVHIATCQAVLNRDVDIAPTGAEVIFSRIQADSDRTPKSTVTNSRNLPAEHFLGPA
jgi:hypothetical protein